jgi:tetratricopeptide (TPR) repeat protein
MDFVKSGEALDRIERRDEAIYRCKELIRQARDLGDYHYKLYFEGQLNAINGLFDDALNKIRKAIELEPHNLLFLVSAGRCSARLNRLHEAVAYYDQALAIDTNNLKALLYKANLLTLLEDHRRALNVYDHVLKLDADNLQALIQRGIVHIRMRSYENALKDLDRVLQREQGNFTALLNRGIALIALGEEEEGLKSLLAAEKLEPGDPVLLTQLAHLYIKRGLYHEALQNLDQILQFEPQDHGIFYNKGLALAKLGYHNEALTYYDLCLGMDSTHKEAWKGKGESLTEIGNHEAALRCFEEALRIDTTFVESLISKITSLNVMGNYREALQLADRALQMDPENLAVYIEKGLAFHGLAIHQKALEAFDMVLRKNPRNVKALFHKGMSLEKLGDFEGAARCFRSVREELPQDSTALLHLGSNLSQLSRHREACEVFDEALLMSPNNYEILHLKGASLLELGRYKDSLLHFSKALELNATHTLSSIGRGKALAGLGRFDEALRTFEECYGRDPGESRLIVEMGAIMARQGRFNEAINYYDRALEMQPKNVEVSALKIIALERLDEYDEAARTIYRVLKNIPSGDARRAFFEFKYEYFSRYKRQESPKRLKAEEIRLEFHEHFVNEILNEFWQDEKELHGSKLDKEATLKTFVTGEGIKQEEPVLHFFGDPRTSCSDLEGYFLRTPEFGVLINPGPRCIDSLPESPFVLSDIDALVITHRSTFTLHVIERLFSFMERARIAQERKAKQEYFIEVQHQADRLMREKGVHFDEIRRMLQGAYDLKDTLAVKKLDFIVTADIYAELAHVLAIGHEWVGEIHLIETSGNLVPLLYRSAMSISAFPGRGEEALNLLISLEGKHVVFAEAVPDSSDKRWQVTEPGETMVICSLGTISREEFDPAREFRDRLSREKLGLLGISVFAQLFNPRLVVLSDIEPALSRNLLRLCNSVSSALKCLCLGNSENLEISLRTLGPRCGGCNNFATMAFQGGASPACSSSGSAQFLCESCRAACTVDLE